MLIRQDKCRRLGAFGADIDYAMLLKLYGASPDSAKGRYSPAECTGAIKSPIEGKPDQKHISTSYAERANLTYAPLHLTKTKKSKPA
jgi:hypothetical protein